MWWLLQFTVINRKALVKKKILKKICLNSLPQCYCIITTYIHLYIIKLF